MTNEELFDAEFEAWARQRIQEMKAEAEEVCQERGIPIERKFEVILELYGRDNTNED